jgi:hypothetical protein
VLAEFGGSATNDLAKDPGKVGWITKIALIRDFCNATVWIKKQSLRTLNSLLDYISLECHSSDPFECAAKVSLRNSQKSCDFLDHNGLRPLRPFDIPVDMGTSAIDELFVFPGIDLSDLR